MVDLEAFQASSIIGSPLYLSLPTPSNQSRSQKIMATIELTVPLQENIPTQHKESRAVEIREWQQP